jgi:hypothetical protein
MMLLLVVLILVLSAPVAVGAEECTYRTRHDHVTDQRNPLSDAIINGRAT